MKLLNENTANELISIIRIISNDQMVNTYIDQVTNATPDEYLEIIKDTSIGKNLEGMNYNQKAEYLHKEIRKLVYPGVLEAFLKKESEKYDNLKGDELRETIIRFLGRIHRFYIPSKISYKVIIEKGFPEEIWNNNFGFGTPPDDYKEADMQIEILIKFWERYISEFGLTFPTLFKAIEKADDEYRIERANKN